MSLFGASVGCTPRAVNSRCQVGRGTTVHTLDDARLKLGCWDHTAVFTDEALHQYWTDDLARADGLLLGRVTYEMMEAAWRPVARRGNGRIGWSPGWSPSPRRSTR